ncbi:serine hydrolase domain-containing protein [Pseudodonghicola flavimaris]|uniref:Serine hydrolase domain-containing protein n=1 Tax=Pseudodonghicola flavimaris TaxID=3050036 RepID=A0ABT7F2F1_9RHOB|nr:serine hydrolase domain-containing protein [Pseudodonghicola flavimaris]MDK3018778.1 serine hydrolase domain-containing protein [Pseudodonghicola flavimaris]
MTTPAPLHSCRITAAGCDQRSPDNTGIFPYWSVTKTAIAICALSLAEAGKLDLDTPLPGQPFTLRQLLGHTAGLPDYTGLPAYQAAVARDEEPWSDTDLLAAALAQGPLFAPGTGWAYSNVGYMLARQRIETAADMPFAALFRTRIGDRLGLDSVTLATTRQHFTRVRWDGARRYHPGWVYHGCLIGTATDAARLLHRLFTGQLLSPAMLEQMLRRQSLGGALPGRPWTDCGYALGLMSGSFGAAGRAIGHSGGGPFSVNAVYHFPDLATPATVACFTEGRDEGVAEYAAAEHAFAP